MEATAAIGHPVAIPIGGALVCENDDPADRRDLRQNVDDMVEHPDAERRPFLRRKQGGQAALALPARFERDHRRPAHDRTARASPSAARATRRSEEHTSELQSLMRNSYAVFCLK